LLPRGERKAFPDRPTFRGNSRHYFRTCRMPPAIGPRHRPGLAYPPPAGQRPRKPGREPTGAKGISGMELMPLRDAVLPSSLPETACNATGAVAPEPGPAHRRPLKPVLKWAGGKRWLVPVLRE